MSIKVLGIQPGTCTDGMTNEEYFKKQLGFMEEAVAKESPYLVMFPECMTGKYFGLVRQTKWFRYAEDFFSGPTTAAMLAECKKLSVHIVYSLFERAEEDGRTMYYNTMGLVSPTRGIVGRYRKIHIPGGDSRYGTVSEKYYFSSGDKMPVFELDNGLKVAMMLCYDRSFPEIWRAYYLKGAQLICMAACTMGLRKDMFVCELRTRALESHCYVIGLNRAGAEQVEGEAEPRKHFGKSLIIDSMGEVMDSLDDEPWSYVTGELDLHKQEWARGRLDWMRDRHPELYGIISDVNYRQDGLIFEHGWDKL